MSPFSDSEAAAERAKRLWILLYMIAGLTLVTITVAIYTVVTRGDDRDAILHQLAVQQRQDTARETAARNANACTGYQNHRAIEEALRDIARLNHIASGKPRVLPSNETIKACKAVHIEIDEDGIPQISNVTSDARPPAVPE